MRPDILPDRGRRLGRDEIAVVAVGVRVGHTLHQHAVGRVIEVHLAAALFDLDDVDLWLDIARTVEYVHPVIDPPRGIFACGKGLPDRLREGFETDLRLGHRPAPVGIAEPGRAVRGERRTGSRPVEVRHGIVALHAPTYVLRTGVTLGKSRQHLRRHLASRAALPVGALTSRSQKRGGCNQQISHPIHHDRVVLSFKWFDYPFSQAKLRGHFEKKLKRHKKTDPSRTGRSVIRTRGIRWGSAP